MYREVTSHEDVRGRENDLADNISLSAQLDVILTMNAWIRKHGHESPFFADRKVVEVRTIKMKRDTAWDLHASTRFDRSRHHMEALRQEGTEVAEQWLTGWRKCGKDFDSYPNDARYPERD
jgi:NTE family protein